MERVLWRGSKEEVEVQKLTVRRGGDDDDAKSGRKRFEDEDVGGGFWNGGEEGAREIGRVGKAE